MRRFMVLAFLLVTVAAFVHRYSIAGQPREIAAPLDIKPEKNNEVCMVTNKVPGKPMIPVDIDGKTYYGCCKICINSLRAERSIRFAKDPVTGREVDKASSFIISGPGSSAMYFESKDTALKYLSRKR